MLKIAFDAAQKAGRAVMKVYESDDFGAPAVQGPPNG